LLAKENDSKITIVHARDSIWFTELFTASNFDELQTRQKQNIE